ncbi:hypothetical protein ACFST9_13715 [Hymenobacter monticola]|uniref:DUF2269 domain-containing protein n=2 Tax=Hymenobacter TaxID=89966 RepID=A0ABY4BBS7_9BACT|nr:MULTISPECIES: hypothetical protein [Hymenobacter]MDU0372244.1 hypothetical protein [Hymenobacter endophyticus]UOE36525.1 hypothetical protein MTP16_24415 [Hymenobacter monticola]
MTLAPTLRKFMLTAHITFSVGWLGAVAVFLALAITGLTSSDALLVRTAYLAMGLSGWFIIVPSSLAALATGVVQALGTPWGLFKHYWVLVKLVLTVGATLLLLLHMQPVTYLAEVAAKTDLSVTDLRGLRLQLLADAAAALVVLLAATAISVYKPWGRIGKWRQQKQAHAQAVAAGHADALPTPWGRYLLIAGLVLLVLFAVGKHLLSGGMGHH